MVAHSSLVCNTNSTSHTDYGKPVSLHSGTDYRTTYKSSHAWIPPFAQDFDARVHKATSKVNAVILNNQQYKSDYRSNFTARASSKNPDQMAKPPVCDTVKYVTTFEQRIFKNPPPPIATTQSETKSAYTMKQADPDRRIVFPPNPYRSCEMRAFGRDEQPPLMPEKPGCMKLLDIYLTTSRADYIPYDERQQRGIACKDIVTYYDASGVPRGGKGYGPRENTKIEPIVQSKRPTYVPKSQNRKESKNPMQSIPHRGYRPEYSERYQPQTKSSLEPYGELLAVATFPSVPRSSPWQTLCAPAMYCTEACHIGTGYPVNATVETVPYKREFRHLLGCTC